MLLNFVLNFKKQILYTSVFIGALSASYWYGVKSVKPQIVYETKVVEKIVEKEVEKKTFQQTTNNDRKTTEKVNKKTTITENKDGTKTTTIDETTQTDTDQKTKTDKSGTEVVETDKISTKDIDTTPVVVNPRLPSRFRSGAFIASEVKDIDRNIDIHDLDYGVTMSGRLLGSVWLDSSYQFKSKSIALGMSVEY
jgi:sRNA-binding protein